LLHSPNGPSNRNNKHTTIHTQPSPKTKTKPTKRTTMGRRNPARLRTRLARRNNRLATIPNRHGHPRRHSRHTIRNDNRRHINDPSNIRHLAHHTRNNHPQNKKNLSHRQIKPTQQTTNNTKLTKTQKLKDGSNRLFSLFSLSCFVEKDGGAARI
jgi:hypothetical protein